MSHPLSKSFLCELILAKVASDNQVESYKREASDTESRPYEAEASNATALAEVDQLTPGDKGAMACLYEYQIAIIKYRGAQTSEKSAELLARYRGDSTTPPDRSAEINLFKILLNSKETLTLVIDAKAYKGECPPEKLKQ